MLTFTLKENVQSLIFASNEDGRKSSKENPNSNLNILTSNNPYL
jgi:hypothetical protein